MDEWLTPTELAERLGLAKSTLANWRCAGTGPAYVRVAGGVVRYPTVEVAAWMAAQPAAWKAA